jgi:trimethylamine--corrinoid protein Co-methyltransferase
VKAALQVLSADERAQIHERTLHVLATAGMRVDTAQGREILAAAGAKVDEATRVVRFPPSLVEESLRLAPKQFSLGARRPGWTLPMNAGESTLVMSGEATQVLDGATGELRPGTRADWLAATRLIDGIDEIGVYWATIEGGGMTGVATADWVAYNADLMRSFSKHVQDSFLEPAWAPWVLEVLQIVFGSREQVRRLHPYSFLITPVSPLIIEQACTDSWLALRGWDIPVAVLPMPMMGATAPGSLLATTLLANCETLGMLCLVQAAEPGTPFIYAPLPVAMDARTGRYASNTFHPVLSAAATGMARHYGLPVMGSGSGADAFVPGAQAGYEKALGSLLGTLAWPDLMVGPGSLGGAMVFSLAGVLIDVEIFRMCRYAHRGIDVSAGLWLDDAVERVGPAGNFIAETSTRRNTRAGEWYLPQLGVHDSYDAWTAAGRPTLPDEARQRADELLAAHEPLPLADDVERELEKLRCRAAKV